jgi:lysozyme family protein
MQANYELALAHVLQYEGGYTNHPADPGGPTNFGITLANLSEWRKTHCTASDVECMAKEEAEAIYKAMYWDKVYGDILPHGLDIAVFDCAVNQGVGRAIKLLQRAVKVQEDGVLGKLTLKAVNGLPASDMLHEFMALRMQAYGSLTTLFRTFGLGWSRRLIATYDVSLRATF